MSGHNLSKDADGSLAGFKVNLCMRYFYFRKAAVHRCRISLSLFFFSFRRQRATSITETPTATEKTPMAGTLERPIGMQRTIALVSAAQILLQTKMGFNQALPTLTPTALPTRRRWALWQKITRQRRLKRRSNRGSLIWGLHIHKKVQTH